MFEEKVLFMEAIWKHLEKLTNQEILQEKKDALEILEIVNDPQVPAHWDQKVEAYLELATIEMQIHKRQVAEMCKK